MGGISMTVLVHLTKGSSKSFVLTFQNGLTQADVKQILEHHKQEAAIRMLITRSSGVMAVEPEYRRKVQHIADFVIGDSYTTQRLA